MTASRLGSGSATAIVAMGIAYAIVLGLGLARHGFSEPITDPILAVMELLTLASALPVLLLVTAILLIAPTERRAWGIVSVCFAVMFATTTSGVHVVELTAGRQLGSRGLIWPSTTYAIELLAWDLFLGISLMFAAATLARDRASHSLRLLLRTTGGLCLFGLLGPAVGSMRLQLIGVFGYAVLLPVTGFAAARWFRSEVPPRTTLS